MNLAVRLTAAGTAALLSASCATRPTTAEGDALDRACTVSECFFERDVRDFEVIGNTTLIVYVGPQRCAFQVELDGVQCDMTMAPDLFFRSARRGIGAERAFASNRICAYDRVEVDGGVFTEGFGGARSDCRIRDVESLTDDQLVELYVARGVVAPPPPIGNGRIEVNENEEGAAERDDAPVEPEPAAAAEGG